MDLLLNQLNGLTHNNIGCVYKQMDSFNEALCHLRIALTFESKIECNQAQINNSAGTILNCCTILSRKNEH